MGRKLLVLCITSIAMLALAEGVARFVLPAPQRVRYRTPEGEGESPTRARSHAGEAGLYYATETGRRLRPNAHVVIESHGLGGQRVEIRTNELGYRNPSLGPRGERRRLLFLGDSITWGDWLPEEDTFVRRIERLSEAADDPVETINAAVGAISLAEELAILRETGIGVEPDLVVLCFYLNDVQPSRMRRPSRLPVALSFSRLAEHLWRLLPKRTSASDREATRRADELVEVMRGEIVASFPGADGDPLVDVPAFQREIADNARDWGGAWSATGQARIETSLREMAGLAREHRFELRVVAFPVLLQVQAAHLQDQPQRWLADLCEELGLPFDDLLPLFRREYRREPQDLFLDHCHHSARGNAIVAQELWRLLQAP